MPDWKKYAYTFLITVLLFSTAVLLSYSFGQRKLNEVKSIESRIAVNLLSSETQFSLLSELSCRDIGSSFFSKELGELGDRLSFMEETRGKGDEEVLNLKRYYSLLQMKDFLLSNKVKERCGKNTEATGQSIVYFYSNSGSCSDCEREGYVLTALREAYPSLRVYAFDYDLDLSALETLIGVYGVKGTLPAMLIDDQVLYGFRSVNDVRTLMPALQRLDEERQAKEAAEAALEAGKEGTSSTGAVEERTP
jgi:hypothetical protein